MSISHWGIFPGFWESENLGGLYRGINKAVWRVYRWDEFIALSQQF